MIDEDRDQERAWVKKVSTKPIALLRRAGLEVSSELREGEPKRELPKAAEEWGADCIFVGSAGFSKVSRLGYVIDPRLSDLPNECARMRHRGWEDQLG
jgi:nucleotide-binding universal stress UspA family protein